MIREIIKNLRKDLGLTQAEMAEKIGVSTTSYANFENRLNGIRNENLEKLEEFLKQYYIVAKENNLLIILKKPR